MRFAVRLTGGDVHGLRGGLLAVEGPHSTRRVIEAAEILLLRISWIKGTHGRPDRMLGHRVHRGCDIRRCHRRWAGRVLGRCI